MNTDEFLQSLTAEQRQAFKVILQERMESLPNLIKEYEQYLQKLKAFNQPPESDKKGLSLGIDDIISLVRRSQPVRRRRKIEYPFWGA